METKQYGLIIPSKASATSNKSAVIKKPAIFDEYSDSDSKEEENIDWVKNTLQKDYLSRIKKRQTRTEIEKVLKDDPTAYQYDEIYDEMEKQKEEVRAEKKKDRKPKYINILMAQAERRKIDNERRMERQIQKERTAEGDEFADKEVFITSSYKKKLEEYKKLDEEEKRLDMLEGIADVSKQKDLSGFYQYLYRTAVGDEDPFSKTPAPPEDAAEIVDKESASVTKQPKIEPKSEPASSTSRQYRKRKTSSDSAHSDAGKKPYEEGLDADSSQTSSDSEEDEKVESSKVETSEEYRIKVEPSDETEIPKSEIKEAAEVNEPENELPKISIWEKRTVGEAFDEALKRYFVRKSAKMMSVK